MSPDPGGERRYKMEIQVSKKELQRAVAVTRKALSKVIIQQERGHVLMSVADGKMKVSGTNNDLKAQCVIDAQCTGADRAEFTADPKILGNVLNKVDLSEVTMSYDEGEQVVKVYTADGGSSFASLQSFPASMMLTFEPNSNRDATEIPRATMQSALDYAVRYLSKMTEDSRNFDIVTVSKGIMYAANGLNMLGFMVSGALKPVSDLRLRKAIIPMLSGVLKDIDDEVVNVIQTASEVGIETPSVYFSALKPAAEPPSVPTDQIKSEGPHTVVDRKLLLKHLDRLAISHTGTPGIIGVNVTLGGIGDSGYLDLSLISSKSVERVPCQRVDDDNTEPVSHMVEYKIMKSVLSSFEHGDRIRLHINEEGGKSFKAYDKGAIGEDSFVTVGIGGYAKLR